MTHRIALLTYLLPLMLLLGTVGAFLLYVPLMAVAAVATILLALGLTFLLGMAAGGRRIRISRMTRRFLQHPDRPAIQHAKRVF